MLDEKIISAVDDATETRRIQMDNAFAMATTFDAFWKDKQKINESYIRKLRDILGDAKNE